MSNVAASVFLSYRREDSAGHEGRICEHLGAVFGPEHVFMDVQDITPGQDFADAIEQTISACQAVVVVIGPRWAADFKERSGGEDFVRHEVAVALRRNVTVIPVLVGGAVMPSAGDLPDILSPLSRRQALEIRDARFDDDAKLLAGALRRAAGLDPAPSRVRLKHWSWILAAAVLLAATGGMLFQKKQPPFNVNGIWIAEIQKPGQPQFRVRLDLAAEGERLTGNVAYPTGDGAIREGSLKAGNLTFFTVHTPQFADREAVIRWTGVVEGSQIRLTESDDSGVGRGLASRRPR
jgi:hypothetical protein